jgi:2-polyprenyl-3-methyl-5-hydroxy-6-metoxy-1,4-benzoquinol methylase
VTDSDLRSPETRATLRPDTPWSLAAPGERWPVIDGIPYLRTGRAELAAEALTRLDRRDETGALAALLADQDDWWDGPAPDEAALRELVRDRGRLSLRDAMERLAYGRVGHYFAHRWSDPTFLAGLALAEAHWPEPAGVFELACGIGHYLREFERQGIACTGADIVFSKLWLARHWVLGPEVRLVCFDAASPWPFTATYDLVLCQDAFYFLEPKQEISAALRAAAGPSGTLLVGHIHNRDADTFSSGRAVTADQLAGLFPDGILYDDGELTDALIEARVPRPRPAANLKHVEAFAVAAGPGLDPRPRAIDGRLAVPPAGTALRRNPLYDEAGRVAWPSPRYEAEYAPRATYPERTAMPPEVTGGQWLDAAARRRELVDLPERW